MSCGGLSRKRPLTALHAAPPPWGAGSMQLARLFPRARGAGCHFPAGQGAGRHTRALRERIPFGQDSAKDVLCRRAEFSPGRARGAETSAREAGLRGCARSAHLTHARSHAVARPAPRGACSRQQGFLPCSPGARERETGVPGLAVVPHSLQAMASVLSSVSRHSRGSQMASSSPTCQVRQPRPEREAQLGLCTSGLCVAGEHLCRLDL